RMRKGRPAGTAGGPPPVCVSHRFRSPPPDRKQETPQHRIWPLRTVGIWYRIPSTTQSLFFAAGSGLGRCGWTPSSRYILYQHISGSGDLSGGRERGSADGQVAEAGIGEPDRAIYGPAPEPVFFPRGGKGESGSGVLSALQPVSLSDFLQHSQRHAAAVPGQ